RSAAAAAPYPLAPPSAAKPGAKREPQREAAAVAAAAHRGGGARRAVRLRPPARRSRQGHRIRLLRRVGARLPDGALRALSPRVWRHLRLHRVRWHAHGGQLLGLLVPALLPGG